FTCVLPETGPEKAEPRPAAGTLLAKLWPAVAEGMLAAAPTAREAGSERCTPTLRRLPPDWMRPEAPGGIAWLGVPQPEMQHAERIEFDWARESARHIGTLVHRVLLQMGREGIARWTAQRIAGLRPSFAIELARLGVPQHEREAALVRTIATLQAVLDDPRGQWLFDPAQGQANGELALSALLDGSV